jgi:hypothetical protein
MIVLLESQSKARSNTLERGPGTKSPGMPMTARIVSRKGSLSDEGDGAGEGLAGLLSLIVRRPEQICSLHELLGPFCHQGRNLLNSVKLSLYLARRHGPPIPCDVWSETERRYREIESLFDRLQLICRPMPLACVRLPLSLLLHDRRACWEQQLARRGMTLGMVAPPGSEASDYDPNYLGRALDSFVSWRAEAGAEGQSALLRWEVAEGKSRIEWIESQNLQVSCESRSCESDEPTDPLALPFLGRVISCHGGEMELVRPGGRHVRLAWPQVVRLSPRS